MISFSFCLYDNHLTNGLNNYSIVKEIARSVDLNTLHALSRTCRQFRANLMPFRQQLVKQTLRCENEYIETISDMLDRGASIPDSVKSVLQLMSRDGVEPGRLTSTKVRKCARDMVGECRRCSRVVCRVRQFTYSPIPPCTFFTFFINTITKKQV